MDSQMVELSFPLEVEVIHSSLYDAGYLMGAISGSERIPESVFDWLCFVASSEFTLTEQEEKEMEYTVYRTLSFEVEVKTNDGKPFDATLQNQDVPNYVKAELERMAMEQVRAENARMDELVEQSQLMEKEVK